MEKKEVQKMITDVIWDYKKATKKNKWDGPAISFILLRVIGSIHKILDIVPLIRIKEWFYCILCYYLKK